jgi:ribose transport system permease protein
VVVGSTTTGPGFLLPVLAAPFLGATQVRERPSVVGTLIAIFILGVSIRGLQLAGAAVRVTTGLAAAYCFLL